MVVSISSIDTQKGARWSAYEVKTEKSCPHVPSIMRGIIEAHLGDAVGLNRKVILERDDTFYPITLE
jgi:hypothetical protein